ncbi:Transcriptional regulatory protein OmpR [freshwater sediment metagenome]|uniref:Transcriptional regulatory protein OmpR n=1 Tax=freshwater sediment metagenome TaxID=556182 RepID=A0AA48M1U7_9ZZZZ
MPLILFVEDDAEIGLLLSRYLGENSFEITVVPNGEAMNAAMKNNKYDLLLLDIGLKGEDGFSICRRIRGVSSIPIIMVTARSDDIDKIVGLECGADDYVVKPFNPRELLARIRSIFRRIELDNPGGSKTATRFLKFDGWMIDAASRRLTSPSGAHVNLTGAEFDFLQAMCEQPNIILSRDTLLSLTHGLAEGNVDRSIDVLVSRLRAKLSNAHAASDLIRTIRAEGYLFSANVVRE